MSALGPNGMPFMTGGYVNLLNYAGNTTAATDAIRDLENAVGDGGVGPFNETIALPFNGSIQNPIANAANRVAARFGRWALNGDSNIHPWSTAMGGMFGGGLPVGGQVGATGASQFAASGAPGAGVGFAFPSNFAATVPTPNAYFGRGGFGGQSTHILGIVGPKLNLKEQALAGLRAKIAAGDELSQTEMLQYQDLMQQQNQLFMFAQNCFTSEHEKIKGWSQALGRI